MSDRRAEDVLSELGRKIDELIKETKKAGNKVSADMEKQIEKFKIQKEKLEYQIKSSGTSEKWNATKEHLNDAAEALHKAFKAIF